jgi:DNA (cytosine-5)-methyltransferase 1
MTRSGVASAPATSARHTGANACFCSAGHVTAPAAWTGPVLPTPTAHDGCSNGVSALRRQGGPSLLSRIRLLPTPQARDGDARGATDPVARRASGHQASLHDAVSGVLTLLPTPTAINPNDSECPQQWLARRELHKARGINGNGMGMPLSIAVRLLPTPTASDAKNCTHRSQTGGPLLPDEVQLLPTPRASDGTKGCPAQRGSKGDLMLPSAVMALVAQHAREGTA